MSQTRSLQSRTREGSILPWLIYPGTMVLALAVYFAASALGASLLIATYAAVLLGAVLVMLCEWLLPERQEWSADRESVVSDLAFMVLVQMLLPKFLALLAAVSLVRWLEALGLTASRFWMHSWPVPIQALAMLLVADFFRYWLHVACHRSEFLWRLHSVHHSPEKLYWLNVGRFHPVEKAFQFFLDALPFILVGVRSEVLALYFVFYAVNGFFQHCNIRLRFGWLNYLISSAELHRWHHSRLIAESNSNYGNNVIIWDLLFGTRFLPKNRRVAELGLINREYPRDFLSQIKTPLVGGIDKRPMPLGTWREVLLNVFFAAHMTWIRFRLLRPMVKAASEPAEAQRRVLRRILHDHRETRFGRERRFREIRTVDDFRRNVSLNTHESLAPYIEEQDRTGQAALNPEQPILYAVTSGTSGTPKYLPVLARSLGGLVIAQRIFTGIQYRDCPDGFRGKILGIAGAAVEGHMPSGIPYGSASGFLYKNMPRLARAKYVLPPEVFEIGNYEIKYRTILRLALQHRDITYIGTANPSTLLRLIEMLSVNGDVLVRDIAEGTFAHLHELAPNARSAVEACLLRSPVRAEELAGLLRRATRPGLGDLWPYLRIVSTWTGGSCGIPLALLKEHLPQEARIFDLGYLASELRVTVTIEPNSGAGLPTLWENFFEFVERDSWERNEPEFLTLEKLESGRSYYVFVTTPSGLFRYAMNDIVEVAGFFHCTPTLRFLQKGAGCTNITGEKLYESQVLAALKALEHRFKFGTRFVQALADESAARYTLYLEADARRPLDPDEVADAFDQELSRQNIEFQAKRGSGRLHATTVVLLRPGTLEALKRHYLASGCREAQFKTVALRYCGDFDFDLSTHTLAHPVARP